VNCYFPRRLSPIGGKPSFLCRLCNEERLLA
jgi:hypothetical protein